MSAPAGASSRSAIERLAAYLQSEDLLEADDIIELHRQAYEERKEAEKRAEEFDAAGRGDEEEELRLELEYDDEEMAAAPAPEDVDDESLPPPASSSSAPTPPSTRPADAPSWWSSHLMIKPPRDVTLVTDQIAWAFRNKRDGWLLGRVTAKPTTFKAAKVTETSPKDLFDSWIWETKYNGHRVRWDGINRLLVSKNGTYAKPPDEWADCQPAYVVLDGEITHREGLGRLGFIWSNPQKEESKRAYRDNPNWSGVVFHAFDIPSECLGDKTLPFEIRKQLLLWLCANTRRKKLKMDTQDLFQLVLSNRFLWKGTLAEQLDRIKKHEQKHNPYAEGIVMKRLDSRYGSKWLKVKYWEDMVCRLKGYASNGIKRIFVIELPVGRNLEQSIEAERVPREVQSLRPGSLVVVRYMGRTSVHNLLNHAHVICEAVDESWAEVVHREAEKE